MTIDLQRGRLLNPRQAAGVQQRLAFRGGAMTILWKRWGALLDAMRAARVRRELYTLSDRTLKDIGLTRAQIDALFR